MEPDQVSGDSDTAYDTNYCSVAEAIKLKPACSTNYPIRNRHV